MKERSRLVRGVPTAETDAVAGRLISQQYVLYEYDTHSALLSPAASPPKTSPTASWCSKETSQYPDTAIYISRLNAFMRATRYCPIALETGPVSCSRINKMFYPRKILVIIHLVVSSFGFLFFLSGCVFPFHTLVCTSGVFDHGDTYMMYLHVPTNMPSEKNILHPPPRSR